MPFNPGGITKEHILKAVARIEREKPALESSTRYDVIINGKRFPPKEVMRYAHEELNGEHIWELGGGPQTNKYLERQDFQIVLKQDAETSPSKRYFLLGSLWYGDETSESPDQFDRFIADGIWENGYDDRFIEDVKDVPVGSKVAIKSSFAKGDVSTLRIKAIGEVVNNPRDGKLLKVEWGPTFQSFDLPGFGSYRKAFHEITDSKTIQRVFFRSRTEVAEPSVQRSLNIILYGPPGTGKTYQAIERAVELAGGKPVEKNDSRDRKAIKEEFDALRRLAQIEFVTFHQNYGYEDFMVGIRPDVRSEKLRFDRHEGVFKQICERARRNWENATSAPVGLPEFDKVFQSYFSKLIQEEEKGVEIPMRTKSFKFSVTAIDLETGRIKFTKQSGGTGHDLLIKNVQGIYEGTLEYGLEGLGVYYYPLVEQLKQHAYQFQPPDEREALKSYVLVVDEINRANISRVFGELITLIEEDKRLGGENQITVTLPNGERDFGVPPNLYILGTMNTADKSIALVDIALRRRFEFIGLYPTSDLLESLLSGGLLTVEAKKLIQALNRNIYAKKNQSQDHLIGHAYFIGKQHEDMESTIKNKIIPLLMEYFSSSNGKVEEMFQGTGWAAKFNSDSFRWEVTSE